MMLDILCARAVARNSIGLSPVASENAEILDDRVHSAALLSDGEESDVQTSRCSGEDWSADSDSD